jgi:putative Mg2+ transporter-C (MgtC) family protein
VKNIRPRRSKERNTGTPVTTSLIVQHPSSPRRPLVAYLLALPIGWDREKSERSAGLRTFPLVAIASRGFIQATEGLTHGSPEATARIVEGLITGMGFVGGGAILLVKDSVRGTATAASQWATGAIGTAVGLGAYDLALVLSLTPSPP